MATIIEQQVAMYEALVPSTQRCPFFKAFLVTADVLEIYMHEFWNDAEGGRDDEEEGESDEEDDNKETREEESLTLFLKPLKAMKMKVMVRRIKV
nr:hypothetical protein [Tanacetum cinerariifolium]